MKEIRRIGNRRVVEVRDENYSLKDLKGDLFDPDVNYSICPHELYLQECMFNRAVDNKGVWGYRLEQWNPEVGKGWTEIDSCCGFVGTFNDEGHYIVDEMLPLP